MASEIQKQISSPEQSDSAHTGFSWKIYGVSRQRCAFAEDNNVLVVSIGLNPDTFIPKTWFAAARHTVNPDLPDKKRIKAVNHQLEQFGKLNVELLVRKELGNPPKVTLYTPSIDQSARRLIPKTQWGIDLAESATLDCFSDDSCMKTTQTLGFLATYDQIVDHFQITIAEASGAFYISRENIEKMLDKASMKSVVIKETLIRSKARQVIADASPIDVSTMLTQSFIPHGTYKEPLHPFYRQIQTLNQTTDRISFTTLVNHFSGVSVSIPLESGKVQHVIPDLGHYIAANPELLAVDLEYLYSQKGYKIMRAKERNKTFQDVMQRERMMSRLRRVEYYLQGIPVVTGHFAGWFIGSIGTSLLISAGRGVQYVVQLARNRPDVWKEMDARARRVAELQNGIDKGNLLPPGEE